MGDVGTKNELEEILKNKICTFLWGVLCDALRGMHTIMLKPNLAYLLPQEIKGK